MFDWVGSTMEQCAKHIAETPPANTYSQIKYHERWGKPEVVEKIIEARKLAKLYRLLARADKIRQEMQEDN